MNRNISVLTFLLASATLHAASVPTTSTAPVSAQLVFPAPPDKPRVRFVRSIKTMRDVRGGSARQGMFGRFVSFMTGGDTERPLFERPYGIWGQGDNIYVTDTGGQKVTVIDLKKSEVSHIGENGDGQLLSPIGVTAGADGSVYVTDTKDQTIRAYSAEGKFLWTTEAAEGPAGTLNRPAAVSLTPAGELLVADTGNRRLVLYSTQGKFLKELCSHPKNERFALPNPSNLWVENDGGFLVSDPISNRIHIFTSTGAAVSGFGEAGDAAGYLARPRGVASDSDGNIHVVDALFHRIQIFNRKGQLLVWYATPGQGPGQLALPAGIFIDRSDTIYVVDTKNQRIQIFQYIKYPEGQ